MSRAKKVPSSKPVQSRGVGNPARLSMPLNEQQLLDRLRELGVDVHGSDETILDRVRRR